LVGDKTGPSPVDRSRSGSKHHLIPCGRGTPLACSLTGGNRNDITQMLPLSDAIPAVRGRRGCPRRRPRALYGDRAYHSGEGRHELRRPGMICLKQLQAEALRLDAPSFAACQR
jgi:hypothetical protein